MKVENELSGIKKNILLKNYTTFKIGGPAKYFFTAKTKTDLIKAIRAAKKYDLPFFILGGGSNLLVADEGYDGIVVKIQDSEFKIKNSKIIAKAGLLLAKLVNIFTKEKSTGIEWAAGIPGTIGGAIRGNAGAFDGSMMNIVEGVEVLDIEDLKIKNYTNESCNFGYRNSIFKQNSNLIILSAIFKLKEGDETEIRKKVKDNLIYRANNHPLNFPSIGSIFENYKSKITDTELLKDFPELVKFNNINSIPAGYLIEKSGLKGKKVGNVQVSEKHCNFIVNLGEGKSKEVITLIDMVKRRVKNKFKIDIKEEIQYLS